MAGTLLNFIEVGLAKDEISISALTSTAKNIKSLREEHGDFYHFYFRNNKIYYWPKCSKQGPELNGISETISNKLEPQIFSKIVENSVVDLLSSIKNQDLFENRLSGLAAYRRISFHSFFLRPKDDIVLGFTLATALDMKFTWGLNDFISKGIDTTPMLLDEKNRPIPNTSNIYHFLETTGKKNQYESIVADIEKNEVSFEILRRITTWLNSKINEIFLPGGLKITQFTLRYLPANNITVGEIYSPARYFYNNATNTQRIPYYNAQVKAYKPFSFGLFEDREIKISVVYPAQYEGRVESFLKVLQKALTEDLHMQQIKYTPIKIDDSTTESYKKGLYSNHAQIKTSDLAIIIINEGHEKLPPNKSPYFVCKAKLIGEGIPTQDIQIETIQNRVHPLVMSNISLNIYAKLGGTAWTIEKEEKLKDELVIGIGSTKSANGNNILGIAQIFHPDGRYIVGNCSPLSTFENYSKNLENYLYETLQQIIETHINTSKSFRLIFHLYKSASEQYEIAAIENVIKRFSNYTFDYALVHLGYGHNFRLYADDGKGTLKKGSFIQITPYMGLLHFVPASILPLKIEIDVRSKGFNDLFYLSKQIFWFSNLSHRSFNPSKKTVTIMYPSLMASLTEKLSLVEGWNYDMLSYVRDKQWFI